MFRRCRPCCGSSSSPGAPLRYYTHTAVGITEGWAPSAGAMSREMSSTRSSCTPCEVSREYITITQARDVTSGFKRRRKGRGGGVKPGTMCVCVCVTACAACLYGDPLWHKQWPCPNLSNMKPNVIVQPGEVLIDAASWVCVWVLSEFRINRGQRDDFRIFPDLLVSVVAFLRWQAAPAFRLMIIFVIKQPHIFPQTKKLVLQSLEFSDVNNVTENTSIYNSSLIYLIFPS